MKKVILLSIILIVSSMVFVINTNAQQIVNPPLPSESPSPKKVNIDYDLTLDKGLKWSFLEGKPELSNNLLLCMPPSANTSTIERVTSEASTKTTCINNKVNLDATSEQLNIAHTSLEQVKIRIKALEETIAEVKAATKAPLDATLISIGFKTSPLPIQGLSSVMPQCLASDRVAGGGSDTAKKYGTKPEQIGDFNLTFKSEVGFESINTAHKAFKKRFDEISGDKSAYLTKNEHLLLGLTSNPLENTLSKGIGKSELDLLKKSGITISVTEVGKNNRNVCSLITRMLPDLHKVTIDGRDSSTCATFGLAKGEILNKLGKEMKYLIGLETGFQKRVTELSAQVKSESEKVESCNDVIRKGSGSSFANESTQTESVVKKSDNIVEANAKERNRGKIYDSEILESGYETVSVSAIYNDGDIKNRIEKFSSNYSYNSEGFSLKTNRIQSGLYTSNGEPIDLTENIDCTVNNEDVSKSSYRKESVEPFSEIPEKTVIKEYKGATAASLCPPPNQPYSISGGKLTGEHNNSPFRNYSITEMAGRVIKYRVPGIAGNSYKIELIGSGSEVYLIDNGQRLHAQDRSIPCGNILVGGRVANNEGSGEGFCITHITAKAGQVIDITPTAKVPAWNVNVSVNTVTLIKKNLGTLQSIRGVIDSIFKVKDTEVSRNLVPPILSPTPLTTTSIKVATTTATTTKAVPLVVLKSVTTPPRISPTTITVDNGAKFSLNISLSENTSKAAMYLACPSSVVLIQQIINKQPTGTTLKSTPVCGITSELLITPQQTLTFIARNTSTMIQTVTLTLTQDTGATTQKVTSQIIINPSPQTSPIVTPTTSPLPIVATPTPTVTATPTYTPSTSATYTTSPSPTQTVTSTVTPTPTASVTTTPDPTTAASVSSTPAPTSTATPTSSATASPSSSQSTSPSGTGSASPSSSASADVYRASLWDAVKKLFGF